MKKGKDKENLALACMLFLFAGLTEHKISLTRSPVRSLCSSFFASCRSQTYHEHGGHACYCLKVGARCLFWYLVCALRVCKSVFMGSW